MSLRGRGRGDLGRGLPVGGMYGLGRDAAAAYGLQAYPAPYAAYAYPGAPVAIPGRTMGLPGGRAPNGSSRGRGGGRGRGGSTNPRPAAPREGGQTAADDVLKVAGSSNVKSLAGAIANRIREGGQAKAVALGAASVNQTVKALAIARAYLENDQLDLAVRPEFIHIPGQGADEPQRSALRFNVVSRPPGQLRNSNKAEEANASEVKIAGSTSPLSAAGAIAKRVREGKKCTVVAMGADSVNQAVKAIAIGRTYLEEDMLDINFKPRFVHVDIGETGDEKKSAVEMTILINQL